MDEDNNKIQYLIVDTSAFIKNAPLQDIGVNIITEQDVVNEITNKRQLKRLVVLPYDLKIQNVFPENIKFVTEFAKKTGDYASLSATDIKVIGLTYQLEKEKVGTEHLKSAPVIPRTIDTEVKSPEDRTKPPAGFYMPEHDTDSEYEEESSIEENDVNVETNEQEVKNKEELVKQIQATLNKDIISIEDNNAFEQNSLNSSEISNYQTESDYETAESEVEYDTADDLANKFANLNCEPTEFKIECENGETDIDDVLPPVTEQDGEEYSDEERCIEENEDEEDNDTWITPNNIKKVKKQMDMDILEEKPAIVACMTMDFAMQNVLMQMGLHVASLDGKVIKQLRTFIFRCYACFKTTSVMTKVFCPNCGNKTLKKVAVSLDDDGKQKIHINIRKPLSARGKRFSLPMPQGGKHASNPILYEDQPMPHQRPSRLARTKNDPLHDDYIAGYSPFIMRDITSKSAMLGIRPGATVKYWMKKNPNDSRKKRK